MEIIDKQTSADNLGNTQRQVGVNTSQPARMEDHSSSPSQRTCETSLTRYVTSFAVPGKKVVTLKVSPIATSVLLTSVMTPLVRMAIGTGHYDEGNRWEYVVVSIAHT